MTLSEDQKLLGEAVDRLVREQYGFKVRRAAIASEAGWNRDIWTQLGELGALGASLPESEGGLGEGSLATMLVMQAIGRGLVIAPYVSTIVCAAALLSRTGSPRQQADYLQAIVRGECVFAFACGEHGDAGNVRAVRTRANRDGGGYRIRGAKSLVVGAPWADQLIVIARLDDALAPAVGRGDSTRPGDAVRLGAFIVSPNAKGLTAATSKTIDGSVASEMRFDNVFVDADAMIGNTDDATAAIERIVDEATVALCAEGSGAIESLLAATVDYAKARKQFGQPIGKFQVLQHRMVDMLIGRVQASSIVHHASLCLTADAPIRQQAVSACKAKISQIGTFVAQAAVQTHGGIGTTDELSVSHYFRRLEVINMQFGNCDDHLRRYADLSGV